MNSLNEFPDVEGGEEWVRPLCLGQVTVERLDSELGIARMSCGEENQTNSTILRT